MCTFTAKQPVFELLKRKVSPAVTAINPTVTMKRDNLQMGLLDAIVLAVMIWFNVTSSTSFLSD